MNFRNNNKEIETSFTKVFKPSVSQKEVFNDVAMPLVENLIAGKNSLLFTYGVTGSGKTYTMTGDINDGGIMPRCIDVIFNSITNYQAKKYVFKPDKLNGFEVQSDADALLERQVELNAGISTPRNPKRPKRMIGHDSDTDSNPPASARERDESQIINIDQDNSYAVFISYVEIYNNCVFDLLDETAEDPRIRSKGPQSKMVREDGNKNMYVNDVNEIEVNSPEDAFQAYNRGQRKRRVAHTALNTESSRSHSIFTIRLVQAPIDSDGENVIQDKRVICISRLSLVDLAGSERTNRTRNNGDRLREAGSINNSLMTLRSCLEILRENQLQGTPVKVVPYRDSKLTHLFRNYFDGEGSVRMIVCINPRTDDYDETIQVMKFAEMTQEVQVTRQTVQKIDLGFTPGRRQANKLFKEAKIRMDKDTNELNTDIGLVYSLGGPFPNMEIDNPHDDRVFKNLIHYLQNKIAKRNILRADFVNKQNEFRKKLHKIERDNFELKIDKDSHKNFSEQQKDKLNVISGHLCNAESQNDELLRKLREANESIKNLKGELHEKEFIIKQQVLQEPRMKKELETRFKRENERKKREEAMKKKQEKQALDDKNKKLNQALDLLVDLQSNNPITQVDDGNDDANLNVHERISKWQSAVNNNKTPRRPAVANLRHRRSQSADRWIDHRPNGLVPVNTVLQPMMRRRKSIRQLTDPKDITEGRDKYCVVTQEQDTDGELETKLYKADIVPTSGGGAQVIFNDVECLKQMSPTAGKRRSSSNRDAPQNDNIPAETKRPRVHR